MPQRPTGNSVGIALVVRPSDPESFEKLLGANEEERAQVNPAHYGSSSRRSSTALASPFPEIQINEALATRPALRNFGASLVPSPAAVNVFARLKFETATLRALTRAEADVRNVVAVRS